LRQVWPRSHRRPGRPQRRPDEEPDADGTPNGKQQDQWEKGEGNDSSDHNNSNDPEGAGEDTGEDRTPGEGDADFDQDFEDALDEMDDQALTDLDNMFDDFEVNSLMAGAMKDATEQLDELETTRKSFGLDPATWKQTNPERRLQIAQQLNTPQMKQLADMMGRMVPYAMGQQKYKVIDMPNNIVTVEMGNDVRRVLRSEFALLAQEETKPEFYRKFVDGELLQFKTQGVKEVGKGPIVICVDNSGSMGGDPRTGRRASARRCAHLR
jgi:uncharacterized protein with von Willebrand factor type A (vWA) domain